MAGIVVSPEVTLRDSFGRFISELQAGASNAVDEIGEMFETAGRAAAPKRTGALAASTHYVRRGNTVFLVSSVDYANIVQEGAQPHAISPGEKGVLVNRKENFGPVFRTVEHPGHVGNSYMEKAFESTWPQAMYIVDANMN